ncbi:uncharacterized protein LOC122399195 isoform X2 [Colletes gigas]|uniref:uncharacterized protein LOC122399195 isoform X2 n=1 Tax=Colletes gigas TaxID=935657 RepID=UPI001C9B3697|nr:uncharacterized protein LOC122399195 isoform X2 [Colletes gigas]
MNGSGFRGRGFGPRGARSNGPTNGFIGPRFPHPNFNHPRSLHRLSGSEKWVEGPNFVPWQKGFVPRPQYRSNLQYRPTSRGRPPNNRGILRFSGPGRAPAHQFCASFIRNPGPRVPLPQEEQIIEEDKSVLVPQIPLLGSEEERQQKITETADKLKEKLSSITEEELTNFWEDDLSVLPNIGSEENNTKNKGIPELRHEPPELNLSFTDFRDIGRIDCNNSKFDNAEDKIDNDDITITFESGATNSITNTNDDIIVINESQEEILNISDSVQEIDLTVPNLSLENTNCQKQTFDDLPDSGCNLENLHLQCDNVAQSVVSSDANDTDRTLSVPNLDENINFTSIEPINDLTNEKSLDLDDIETTSISATVLNDQDASQVNFSQSQNTLQSDTQDIDTSTVQNINVDLQQNEHFKSNVHQLQDHVQTNLSEEEACQISTSTSDTSQNNSIKFSRPSEEIQANIVCDSKSPICSTYNEVQILNNPPAYQPRIFNIPPRFAPRIPGPRCRWSFQQNGNNLFFRGPQKLPFHGNRMPPPRHIAPYNMTDLVPITFDPRAPPPFTHNVPALSHDSQHHALVPFSSKDLPLTFDPSEPPPNIRTISVSEPSNRQEITQTMPPLDSRNQIKTTPTSNIEIMQTPAFDPREPPPRITNVIAKTNETLPEFNPQQPPPKIHKRDETLQPPPIFDPRLSSQERSKLIAPLNTPGAHMMGMKLMEPSQISVLNITPASANFSQPLPVNMPSHQTFMPNLPVNFQSVLPQANSGQVMVQEFALPVPPINITDVPLPIPQEPLPEKDPNHHHGINMDDGLEDMQEAMEFAKQIMNMTEEMKINQDAPSVLPETLFTPSEIPVPFENKPCFSSANQANVNITKKQKKKDNKSKKSKHNVICGPGLILEKHEETGIVDEEQCVQNLNKNIDDALLAGDQIRPKVVFNLNSKTKVIQKPEEWHRTPINIPENKETSQQVTIENLHKERKQSKKHSEHKRNNTNQTKNQEIEHSSKMNSKTSMVEKPTDASCHQDYLNDSEKLHLQKSQKLRNETKKTEAPTAESSWKSRVINRFLKMSKNDICNMVNNSSLRKFDIAMKHLVKERRSSLSLKMRNTEDEKMKEYDREEFMTQLNAMLDPGAVVGITDLPTEFIHHLSEVLQLDPMPSDIESSEKQSADIDKDKTINQNDTSRTHTSEYLNQEIIEERPSAECTQHENKLLERVEEKSFYTKEEPSHYSLTTELNLNISRENTNSSKRSLLNKSNPEPESTYKIQQPLFNEADLDDILSQVTERTKNQPNTFTTSREPRKSVETHKAPSLLQSVTKPFECNSFAQFFNTTAADLDDIFSAGIARAKSLSKSGDSINSRARKSSSEDRNTFRSEKYENVNRNKREDSDTFRCEKYERWNRKERDDPETSRSEKYERWKRKEREDPDMFRNLTKEEWEAKYGSMNTSTSIVIRKISSNSAENLSRDSRNYQSQRYCSSDSPMRHLSMSPTTREIPAYNPERCSISRYNELEDLRRAEYSESSTDSSTNSSSDSDEEAVSTNVTKLLKVIKENEKIAKQKTLNETIRDEVTAEIEKKWKEKSKYRDRKFRKREKRKRDRRDKRKRKKRRKRNSHSDLSKSSEQSEEFRLLTEDEIKKEVVVKEEPESMFEETVLRTSNNEINTTLTVVPAAINKTAESVSQIEFPSSETVKHQVPAIICDKMPLQVKIKSTTISMMVQPKTKAQLKQMPESGEPERKQTIEKSIEIAKSTTDNEKMKEQAEENKDKEIAKTNNDQIDAQLPTDNVLSQTNTSLNVTGQRHTEIISGNNTANMVSCNITNPVIEISTNVQNTDLKALPTSIPLTETKGGYKKIDIKAYKERALQRRLKEEAKLKENSGISISLPHNSQHALPLNKTYNETETSSTMDKLKVTEDVSKAQLKDPRLTKMKIANQSVASPKETSSKEVKEKINLEGEHLSTDVLQNNTELSASVQSKSINEGPTSRSVDVDLNPLTDSVKSKDRKSDAKPLPQEKLVNRELEDHRMKAASRIELEEKKSKKSSTTAESTKFKNIRSEGSKELKLKKDKKSTEKKKKSMKSKPLSTEKDLKHSEETEETQNLLVPDANSAIKTEIERANSCDSRESLQSEKVNENLLESTIHAKSVVIENSINCEMNKESVNTQSIIVEENDKRIVCDNEIATDINEILPKNQQVTDQRRTEADQNSKTRESSVMVTDENSSKSLDTNDISPKCIATEQLNKEKNIKEEVPFLNDILSDSCNKSVSNTIVSTEDPYCTNQELHFSCLRSDENLKNDTVDSNFTVSAKIDLEIIGESSTSLKAKVNVGDQNENKSTPLLQDLQTLDDCSKTEESEVRSPDSSGSPFKGFLSESIEDDIHKVSQLYTIEMSDGDSKEIATEGTEEWLKTRLNDRLSTEARSDDNDDENNPSMEMKETNEPTSVCASVENKSSTTENIIAYKPCNRSSVVNNIETVVRALETRDKDIPEEFHTCNINMRRNDVSPMLDLDSQDTFDENGEPFIVLDEYIDDTDGRSIEKLSTLDLDLEDCIAREMDIFSSRPLPEVENSMDNVKSSDFNSISFKELSKVFDTNDVTTIKGQEKPTSIETNSNIMELFTDEKKNIVNVATTTSSESNADSKLMDPVEPEVLTESSRTNAPPVNDILKESQTSDLSCTEMEKTAPKSFCPIDVPRNNLQHDAKILTDLNVAKPALSKSSENLSLVTSSPSEVNVEFLNVDNKTLKLNKGTFETNKDTVELHKTIAKSNKETLKLDETAELNKKTLELNKETVEVNKETSVSNENTLQLNKDAAEAEEETSELNKETVDVNNEIAEVDKEFSELNKETSANNKETLELNIEPNKKLDHSPENKIISTFSETPINKDAYFNLVVKQEKSKQLIELVMKEQEISGKSDKRKENKTLHKMKSKHSMKHKQQMKCNISKKAIKEAVRSDSVKVKHPTTKEAIMARMIEIDVEIHKLMTEKMTLYQKLRNNALPTNSDSQANDTINDNKELETAVVGPRTPSALMSQLIQNIDASPVTNQCAKTTVEIVPSKDSSINPVRINKSEVSKHERHAEKKTNCIFAYGSDNEQIVHPATDTKAASFKRRRRHRGTERVVNWEYKPAKDTSSTTIKEKQSIDAAKSLSKKTSTKQEVMKQNSSQDPTYKIKSQEESNDVSKDLPLDDRIEACNAGASEQISEQIESQVCCDEYKPTAMEQVDETVSSLKDNEDETEALNDTDTASSVTKALENRTPERSSIYSDDSTWDSLLQTPSDDQKKPATGLALLEETYRKEMAKTRRIRIEARRRRKQKRARCLPQTVNTLTPEEEELPLSTLYVKKVHKKRKLLNFLDEQLEKTDSNQQLWKNVDEVINAVAENRTESLYTEKSGQLSSEDKQNKMPDVDYASINKEQANDSEANLEPKSSKEEKQMEILSMLKNFKEVSIELSSNSNVPIPCDGKDNADSNLQSAISFSKPRNLSDNEGQAHPNLVSVESLNMEDSSGASVIIETNVIEPSVQQIVEDNDVETSKIISVESSDACTMKSNTNTTQNNQNILNIPEANLDTERTKNYNTDKPNKESNLQENIVNAEKTVSLDTKQVITVSDDTKSNHDSSYESSNYDDVATTSEITTFTTRENANAEIEILEEDLYKDSLLNQDAQFKNDDTNGKDEFFISIKEQKVPRKRRESERSNKSSNEENDNRNRITILSLAETTDACQIDEAFSKKLSKRRRENSKPPLRRSSRYTEEFTKHIKLEADGNVQNADQDLQILSVSPTPSLYEEAENVPTNVKKIRSVEKPMTNRKRYMHEEIEILSNSSGSSDESKYINKRRKLTVLEMMNCTVNLVDIPPSPDHQSRVKSMQSTSTKDIPSPMRRTSTPELLQGQSSKLVNKPDNVMRSMDDQIYIIKVKKGPKSMNIDLPENDEERCSDTDIEVMPILTKEQVVVDISHDREKPDIEIVEEKTIVTKNQHYSDSGSTLTVIETKDDKELPRTQYTVHKGPILDIKVFENSFLAASEDGRIYRYSQLSNGILNIYKGHKAAVTCLYVYNTNVTDIDKEWMFSGSLDGTLRCYNVTSGLQIRDTADVGSPIQCMDEAWGIIFIGTKSGHVSRYHVKSGVIRGNSIQFSEKSVLALKATNEGPRRVLIVASRSQPITIRDAQNGLFLRTICGQKNHTVYSLMRDNNLIYCGTSTTSILVFDFTNGDQMMQYDAGVGIVCMQLYKQLLFAGCYDGNIYVFDTKDHRLVCSIPGPGNMLLSMEIIDNKIIAGSKDKRLQSWQMSRPVQALL